MATLRVVVTVSLAVVLLDAHVPAAPVVWAAPFIVTRTDDPVPNGCLAGDCSLREAVIAANVAAGADSIDLQPGTYTLQQAGAGEQAAATGDLDISGELTITGSGEQGTTIDANHLDRAFDVLPAATLTLEQLTVRHGLAEQPGGGAVLIEDDAHLELNKVVLLQNKAEDASGGGINHLTNATSSVNNSTITRNEAGVDGGGIIVRNPGVASTIVNSTINDNTAGSVGGGIASLSLLEIRNSRIEGNRTLLAGGAGIYHSQLTMILQNTRVQDNEVVAGGDGGGIALVQNATATLRNGSVRGNRANSNGGGITVVGATLSLVNVHITDNVADADGSGNGDGGGISIYGNGSVTSTNTKVDDNQDNGAPFFPNCFPAAPCPP